jgi:GT2 family glycosyltransferase
MTPDISVAVVSFNTRDLLKDCLTSLYAELQGIPNEVIVVDNASGDGSADMVEREFPAVVMIRSAVNLGFAAANNRALALATGRYAVLLNSDAFLRPGALRRSIDYMDAEPRIGWGGARLIGPDGRWQASARMFPSPLNDFLALSGLAAKFSESQFFGRQDHTWADPDKPMDTDWLPGAFAIIRRSALETTGFFDEQFFLYYEEVDLCRRMKQAGYRVRYWPDVVVVHLGGASSKTLTSLPMRASGQLELWRMRSAFLYYRKHHGNMAVSVRWMEEIWHRMRAWKNKLGGSALNIEKTKDSQLVVQLLHQAWRETSGGAISPARPW